MLSKNAKTSMLQIYELSLKSDDEVGRKSGAYLALLLFDVLSSAYVRLLTTAARKSTAPKCARQKKLSLTSGAIPLIKGRGMA
jgi:hypothetical protein